MQDTQPSDSTAWIRISRFCPPLGRAAEVLLGVSRNILSRRAGFQRIMGGFAAPFIAAAAWPPPCLRRVRAREEPAFIKGSRALLDEKMLGYEVTVFPMVPLTSQADPD